MSARSILRLLALTFGLAAAMPALAQNRFIVVATGISGTLGEAIGKLVSYMVASASGVCLALFALGALFMVISRGQESQLKRGKDLMINSLEGFAVILASYGILRMVVFLLY